MHDVMTSLAPGQVATQQFCVVVGGVVTVARRWYDVMTSLAPGQVATQQFGVVVGGVVTVA